MFRKKKTNDIQPSFSSWDQSGLNSPGASGNFLNSDAGFGRNSSEFLSTIPTADQGIEEGRKDAASVAFENGYSYQNKKKSVWKYLIPALLILGAALALMSPLLKGYRTIIKPKHEQTASFEIVNDLDENCYFYLNNDNDACDSAFLVQKGKAVVVKLPEGEYDLFYACGKKWKGIEEKFGPTTEYYKANHSYVVSNDDIWTVTVYESSDGESNIEQISPSEFPN